MIPHVMSRTAPSNSTPNSLASWRMGFLDSASAKTIKLWFASRNAIKSLGSTGVLNSKTFRRVKFLTLYSWRHQNDIIVEELIIVFDLRSWVCVFEH